MMSACLQYAAMRLILLAALIAGLAQAGGSQGGPQELRHAGRDWPDLHGGMLGWHYSALDEIDARNVARLRLVWTHSPDLQTEGLESVPVVADGLLAYCSGTDQVWVLDAATGRQRWHARVGSGHAEAADARCRGLAFDGQGGLYFAGAGGHVAAWTAATGELRWDTQVLPREAGRGTLSGPPMVIGDRMVVGSLVAAPGERGVLLGIDTRSGREVWRVELAGGSGPDGSRWNGAASWGGSEHAAGASAPWPGAYDATAHLLYWGVGSPLPLLDPAGAYYQTHGPRPGDNLFTAGVLAIDPQTGALHGWHQEVPHETWVRDSSASELLLLDRDGRHSLVHPNRDGLVFVYDADLKVQRVWPAIRNFNLARAVVPASGSFVRRHDLNAGDRSGVCPLYQGAFPGLPGAFSPQTGLWYKIGAEWCMDINLDRGPDPALPEGLALGGRVTPVAPPDGRVRAHLDARDPLSGAKMWTVEFPEPPLASLLVTAGRLLFVADGRGALQALDAGSGRSLWHVDEHEGHAGGVISYQAGGHQYIALVAGWDPHAHPMYARLFGAPYNGARTPRAALRVYRLP